MLKVSFIRRVMTFASSVTLLLSCSDNNPSGLLQNTLDEGEVKASGIVTAARDENGNVRIDFRGLSGAEEYTLFEESVDGSSTTEAVALTAKILSERQIQTLKHVPGTTSYTYTTSDIPFGNPFCYRVTASMKSDPLGKPLPRRKCLADDDNWLFKGVVAVNGDDLGRIQVRWTQVPARGSSYEIFRKVGADEANFPEIPATTVTDGSSYTEELVGNTIFPRCYLVKVSQQLFSKKDVNKKEVCIDKEKYFKDRSISKDQEAPKFAGIKTINAVPYNSLLDRVGQMLGMQGKFGAVLTWDAATDAISRPSNIVYRVYRASKPWGYDFSKPYATTKPGDLNYTDSSLEDGVLYYYLVRALDEQENEERNLQQAELPIDNQAPVFAGLASVTYRRENTSPVAVLTWEHAQDDKSPANTVIYRIFRAEKPEEIDYKMPLTQVTGLPIFEDRTLVANKVYHYSVRAFDKFENSDSNLMVRRLNTGETPPTFLGLDSVRLVGISAQLQWRSAMDDESKPSNIRYRIYRRESTKPAFDYTTPLAETASGILRFEDASLDPNKTWVYAVRAMDELNFEDQNTKSVVLVANQPPVMSGPPTVRWDVDQQGARITWPSASDDITTPSQIVYKIYRSSSPNAANFDYSKPLETTAPGVRSFVDTSINSESAYSYVVRGVDEANRMSEGDEAVSLPPNDPPTFGQVSGMSILSNPRSIGIQWSPATDDRTKAENISYKVYRFLKPVPGQPLPTRVFNSTTLLAALSKNRLTYQDSQIDWSQDYAYVIRAVDETLIESINTQEVSLGTNLAPVFPGLTSLESVNQKAVTLKWPEASDDRTPNNALTYKIYRMAVAIGSAPVTAAQLFVQGNIVLSIKGAVTVQTLNIEDPGKTYYFGIRVFDEAEVGDTNAIVKELPGNAPPVYAGIKSLVLNPTGSVSLSWLSASDDKDPSSQIRYNIYKLETTYSTETASNVACAECLFKSTAEGQTSVTDDNVNPAVYTHYVVRALDTQNAMEKNSVMKVQSPDSQAPAFGGIRTAEMKGFKISLSWNAATDDRTAVQNIVYKVYESTSNDISVLLGTTPVATLAGGVTSYDRDPPNHALTYYYVVKAVDQAGNVDGNAVLKETKDVVAPDFAGLTSAYAVGDSSVQLFWSKTVNNDISEFRVYDTANISAPIAILSPRDITGKWVSSFIVTGLLPAKQYSFAVRAADAAGNEEKNTQYLGVTTLSAQGPLFAGLASVTPRPGVAGLSSVHLRWSSASNATHYRVFRVFGSSDRGEEFDFNYDTCAGNWDSPSLKSCKEIDGGLSELVVTGLSQNTTYSFVVRAVRKEGVAIVGSEYNRVIIPGVTLKEQAPTFAGALTAAPQSGTAGLNSVDVNWGDPEANGVFDSFVVLYKAIADEAVTTFAVPENLADISNSGTLQAGVRQAVVSGLTTNTRYCFTVLTLYSPKSEVRSIATNGGFKCTKPVATAPEFAGIKNNPKLGEGGSAFDQVTIYWDKAQGSFTDYEVSYAQINDYVDENNTGNFFSSAQPILKTSRDTLSHSFTGLTANKVYYFRVRARFNPGNGIPQLTAGGDAWVQVLTTPKAPAGDAVASVTQINDTQVKVTWQPPNNGGLFNRIYMFKAKGVAAETDVLAHLTRQAANNPPYATAPYYETSSTSTTEYVDSGFASGDHVCYLVRFGYTDARGFIDSSNAVVKCADVIIKPPLFDGVSDLKAPNDAFGFTSLVAKWTPATENFTKYQYAVGTSPNPENWQDVLGSARETAQYAIPGLTANTDYYVRIRAVYVVGNQVVTAGESIQKSARTTPLAPQQTGLDPIVFLAGIGEVQLSWDAPNADPDLGGVYDRYLLWKMQGTRSDVMAEISTLMADNYISTAEIADSRYHITEVAKGITSKTYTGASAIPADVSTCFLLRAAFVSGNKFLMSDNTRALCVTPTASAPLFSGISILENIPGNVNGFENLTARWAKAGAPFTRYELAISTDSNSSSFSWNPLAFDGTNIETISASLSAYDKAYPAQSKLVAHQSYYARVRAVYVNGNSEYKSGEQTEAGRVLRPDLPTGDGLVSATLEKVAGVAPKTRLVIKGNAAGFWDRVFVFRAVGTDKNAAIGAVQSASAVKSNFSGFEGAFLSKVLRAGVSTSDILTSDNAAVLGQWNCYLVRSGYEDSNYFLASTEAKTPICVFPSYEQISFSGLASAGNDICDGDNCSPTLTWPATGNSKVRLKFATVPQGDIDFYRVYMSMVPDADKMLAGEVFQEIPKGDSVHDANAADQYLYIGGGDTDVIPEGELYFMVRAVCLGCPYTDENTSVSNAVLTKRSFVGATFNFTQKDTSKNFVQSLTGGGQFSDVLGLGAFQQEGLASLETPFDYLRSSMPGQFAPKAGRTIAMKFELKPDTVQNTEGAAIFALDSGPRWGYWNSWDNNPVIAGTFGNPGASSVFDENEKVCLFMGAQDLDFGSDVHSLGNNYRERARAYRLQAWDGKNLSEIYPESTTNPFPRSYPELAYNPLTRKVMLYGGVKNNKVMADTWEWDGKTWKMANSGPSPDLQRNAGQPGRFAGQAMTYDPFKQKMMMLGGRYGFMNDRQYDSRTDKVWHYDAATGWTSTYSTPAAFPKEAGFNSALVTVKEGTHMGVYFVGMSNYISGDWRNSDIWKWDGTQFKVVATSALPYATGRTVSNVYAWWDETKQRIGVSFGNWDTQHKRIFEWSPASNTWAVQNLSTAAPQSMYGSYPCYDKERKELVDYGGVYANNNYNSAPNRRSFDLWLWNGTTWRSAMPQHDPSGQAVLSPLNNAGAVHMQQSNGHEYTFTKGVWDFKHIAPADISSKQYPWENWWRQANMFSWCCWASDQYTMGAMTDSSGGLDKVFTVGLSAWNDTTPSYGRGRPKLVGTFDGNTWTKSNIVSSDIYMPENICTNLTDADSNPNFRAPWSAVRVPWEGGSTLLKSGYFEASLPYALDAPDPGTCTSTRSRRLLPSHRFSFLVKESGNFKIKEVKLPNDDTAAAPFRMCESNPANVDSLNGFNDIFAKYPPIMLWDSVESRVLLIGYQNTDNAWVHMTNRIQSITYSTPGQCYLINNLTATNSSTAWNGSFGTGVNATSYIQFHRMMGVEDPTRNVFLIPGNYWSTNYNSENSVWEFNKATLSWRKRDLPSKYQKQSANSGNYDQAISPVPGRPGVFLIKPAKEIHTNRDLTESYFLKVTDNALSLEPTPSRFGLSLGADGTTGYLSVPGDGGEVHAGTTVLRGQRSIGTVEGVHSLVISFSATTYDAYLDGVRVISGAPWAGNNLNLYAGEFILGARFGYYGMFRHHGERAYKGYGNTRVNFNWLRTFDKVLTDSERDYWLTREP